MKVWEHRYDIDRKMTELEKLVESRDAWVKNGMDHTLLDDCIEAHVADLTARFDKFQTEIREWQAACRSSMAVQESGK